MNLLATRQSLASITITVQTSTSPSNTTFSQSPLTNLPSKDAYSTREKTASDGTRSSPMHDHTIGQGKKSNLLLHSNAPSPNPNPPWYPILPSLWLFSARPWTITSSPHNKPPPPMASQTERKWSPPFPTVCVHNLHKREKYIAANTMYAT